MGFVFALGFFGILAVVLLVFAAIAAVGLILLIIYAVMNHKARKSGKTANKALLIIGSVIFLFPLALVVSIVIFKAVEFAGYDNFRERWINSSWINGTNAKYDVIEEFFPAAERGDKEAIIAMFSESRQNLPMLEHQVDQFLQKYPKGLSDAEFDFMYDHSDGMHDFDRTAVAELDGKKYYVTIGGCCSYYNDPTKIGLRFVYIQSEDEYALRCDSGAEFDHNATLLFCVTDDYDQEIRTIDEHPVRWESKDRLLTVADIESAATEERSRRELIELLGEPNAECKSYEHYIYELAPTEEYTYAIIHLDYWGVDFVTYKEPRNGTE